MKHSQTPDSSLHPEAGAAGLGKAASAGKRGRRKFSIMRSMRIRWIAAGLAMGAVAWGADPFLATWKMRAATAPLESSTLTITASGVAHRLVYRMTYAPSAGIAPVSEMFVTNLDGRESTAILGN